MKCLFPKRWLPLIFFRTGKNPLPILITILFACYSCFPPPADPKAKPILIDQATLELSPDGNTIQGTGRVLFDQTLFGLNSKELYSVKADFLNSNSVLILHSHLSDFMKQDGVKVLLKREGNNLALYTSTPGYKARLLNTELNYFSGSQQISLYIEVENGTENFVDISVWDFYINPKGYLKTPSTFFSRENQLAHSSEFLFYSKGQGILWGVELNEVRLIQILRESPNSL